MEELRAIIAGHYDMTCAELPHIYSYWELREDGTATQDNTVVGTWGLYDNLTIITYSNPEHGHTVLSIDSPNVLVGENRHRNGAEFSWRMVKVVP